MPGYLAVGYPPRRMADLTPLHSLPSRSPSVLIIDDDEYVHGALEAALRGLRVHLLTAHTAAEGEELALEHTPLLAIVDVGLPDRDGYQLTADLRKSSSLASMRILILTGQSPDEAAANDAGANGLIQKPFRLHHFLDVVREQLGTREHHQEHLPAVFARGA
jgi:two-component system, OmpR family, KDP operon response regulator KdpE